jgi:hypothetical protein
MNYDVLELFGDLPAAAGSFNELLNLKDNMVILEVDGHTSLSKKDWRKFLEPIIDVLNEDSSTRPLLLKCAFNTIPSRGVIQRTLYDGHIWSAYFDMISSEAPLKQFIVKNRKKLSYKGNIICFQNALLAFGYDYLFIVAFDEDMLNSVREICTEFNYVYSGRNYSGLQTLGLSKFDDPYLDFYTPAKDSFSYAERLDKTTKETVKAFSPVDYVLRSCNNRLLDKGYFIRVNLDDGTRGISEERSLLEILQCLDPIHQKMRMIYHGVIADSVNDNHLLMSGIIDNASDGPNFRLQSFLSLHEVNACDFLRGKFDRVLLDQSVFFNKDMIFTFYDLGADFRFFNKDDYEAFFESSSKNHTIQMASYIPGREDEDIYPRFGNLLLFT